MPYETERREILKLIQEKKITAEEGARLIAALTGPKVADSPAEAPGPVVAGNGRTFHLAVNEPGGQTVNVRVPVSAVTPILRFAARWVPREHRDMLEGVQEAMRHDIQGDVLNIAEPGGQSVRIWIE